MFIVRFPNGVSVTYHDATFLNCGTHSFDLYSKEGGVWIASIPIATECIIETYARLHDLKMALKRFNAKTGSWNEQG